MMATVVKGESLNDIVKLANHENPYFDTRFWDLSPIKSEL